MSTFAFPSMPHPALPAGGLNGIAGLALRAPVLPWTVSAEDEQRFRRILKRILAVVLLMAVVMPLVPLSKPDRAEVQALPPPMARLLLERQLAPPAPPSPKPDATTEAAHTKPEAAPDKPAPVAPPRKAPPVPEARQPVEGKPPGEVARDNARRKASGVGLLAMKNELAELTGAAAAVQLKQDIKPGPGIGTGVGVGVGAGQEPGVPVRALITSNAALGSGGINTAAYSRDTGGGGTRAGGGGGGTGNGGMAAGKGGALNKGASGKASRSIEEIKLVFERNKGAIYALYNRALRDEPELQGKVVLELKIAPGGQVDGLRIVSSELKADELERKLLARIRQFDFGAKDVDVMVVTWPVDFLPS